MTSWGGNRQYAQVKKVQESVSYFQTTQDDVCSNFTLLFSAYLNATRNSSLLYIHDFPNSIGATFPMLQAILRENSSIKYLKEVPEKSKSLDPNQIAMNPYLESTNIQTLKRVARDLFFYNSDAQDKIMTRIRSAGLERTAFDVGVHISTKMGGIPIQMYVNALQSFSRRLGKANLSIFVMTENKSLYTELVKESPQSWNFTNLQSFSKDTIEDFYQFLTELHILQNTPNLIVNYSDNIGRFLYLSSRFQHTTDSITSLDIQQWSLF
jgi:hypothetical protein